MGRGLLVLMLLLAGPAAAATAGASPAVGSYLQSSPAHHTVRLTLLAGLGAANNGFNFDGYGRGELVVTVPRGWRVLVDCENRGSLSDSCAVVKGSLSTTPVFTGAASPQPTVGIDPGAKAAFSFRATRAGTYRIASLVPGHEQARMWAVLVVGGKHPSITARRGP